MDPSAHLKYFVAGNPAAISKVIEFDPAVDKFYHLDLTAANTDLDGIDFGDEYSFSGYINRTLQQHESRYGIGGYMEHRAIYKRSPLFDTGEEPRRLHLGVDIWAQAGMPVYSPLDGIVHSFADNNHFGDYGPTIILQHDLDGSSLYSLYGHVNRECLNDLHVGKIIMSGQKIGEFGEWAVNGCWPPHLHFQLMFDIQGHAGDYPGVGKFSEKEALMANIPDPNIILQIPTATIIG